MALERGAVRLGAPADDASVRVVLGFTWRNRAELERFVRAVHDPRSPLYQQFLSAREFTRRFAPRASQLAAAARFLRRHGLRVVEITPSRLQVAAVGPAARVAQALQTGLLQVRDSRGVHTVTAEAPRLPEELGAQVVAVGAAATLAPPGAGPERPAVAEAPFAPDEIARLYGFDALYGAGVRGEEGRHATIAIATAFDFDPRDLTAFWRANGIARDLSSVELITVSSGAAPAGPASAGERMETTLDVEWASAMAPGSRVLVYAASDASSTTLLRAYDRIVSDNRAAVLTTSWGRCETDHPVSYLNQVDAIFLRAAAQGITVIAASGDAGAFSCGDGAPGVSFPASHPYVLAVGGTALRPRAGGFEEIAWSGSGGGISQQFAAPVWQMHSSPQRVLADVAFNADLGSGYLMLNAGTWLAAGGTSVGAPIWAALVALANQARAAAGRGALGLAAPQLCELALDPGLAPAPFVDVRSGENGAYAAAPGWDVPTGWGSPRAAAVVEALAHWTPPADGRGGVASLVPLAAIDGASGAVRLRFQRRCASTEIDLHARDLTPGPYTLWVDGTAVASFATDAHGDAILTIPRVDLRGCRVQLTDDGGEVRFALPGDEPEEDTGDERRAALISTGMAPGTRGTLSYRRSGGREQLGIVAQQLPIGRYDVRIGTETIGTLTVTTAGTTASASFDTLGIAGATLPLSPLCKPVLLVRNGSAYLRSVADALAPGQCSGSQRRA